MIGLSELLLSLLMAIPPENVLDDFWYTVTSPFTDLLGNWFYAAILVIIVGGVYIKTESYGPPLAVMIIASALLAGVIVSPVRYFFALLTGMGITALLFVVYRGRH